MNSKSNDWLSLVGLVSELKKCDENGLITASLAMSFVCIDTLASLSRSSEKLKSSRSDFQTWVDTYMEAHHDQPYKYRGEDVYAARCAFLHEYSSDAELHIKNPNIIKYIYHDGGKHIFNPDIEKSLVIIGIRSFVNDVICAANAFLNACGTDNDLRNRVEPRLTYILQCTPIANYS